MPRMHQLRWIVVPLLALLPIPLCAAGEADPTQLAVLDAATANPSAQAVVGGELDAAFHPATPPLLRAGNDRSSWYRVRLSADWNAPSPPMLTISGDVRARVLVYLPPDHELRLTVSIGLALLDESTPTMESLIAHADSALYRAKAQGRNRVMHYLGGEDAGAAALDQRG
jgi:hypothetical protein